MFDIAGLALLLLPVAAASGWLVARRSQAREKERAPAGSSGGTKGLDYLVSENPDKAIELFERLVDVDDDTVETHLALGNLFRRRGEVERALRIHENLVVRPNLKAAHRERARLELARDYLRAGVLDRAETLFLELVEAGQSRNAALRNLITIYEKERDWQRAIETSHRLEAVEGESLSFAIAHYWCELAEDAVRRREPQEARRLVRRALSEDSGCVRASLLRGRMHEHSGDYSGAARAYSRVMRQNGEFITEILEPLERCYRQMEALDGWRDFLIEASQRYNGVAPHVAMARLLQETGQGDAATEHLGVYLERFPSWLGFYHLLDLTSANSGGLSGPLDSLRQSLQHIMQTTARYQCAHCGFSGRSLHWQCPGCLHWNSVRPLKDLRPTSP